MTTHQIKEKTNLPWWYDARYIGNDKRNKIKPRPLVPGRDAVSQGRAPREFNGQLAAANMPLPIIYGTVRVSAPPFIVGNIGNHLVVAVIWGEGQINGYNALGCSGRSLNQNIGHHFYLGTSDQTPDSWLMQHFAARGVAYADALPGIAYSVFNIPPGVVDAFPSFSAKINGINCFDPRLGYEILTDNPALALADFIGSTEYGQGKVVDMDSVIVAANACDELVGGEKRRTFGLALTSTTACDSIVETLRAYAGCIVVDSDNGVKLIPDRPGAVVKSFTDANMSNVRLKKSRPQDAPTVVEIKYTIPGGFNPDSEGSVTAEVASSSRRESVVSMPGIRRKSQANREAIERLNHMTLEDLEISFDAFDDALAVERGDIIDVTTQLGLTAKQFRVSSASMTQPGRYSITAREYDPAAYSDAVVAEPTSVDTSLPDPTAIPSVTGLSAIEQLFSQNDGTVSTRFEISFDAPAYAYQANIELRLIKVGDGRIWRTLCDVDEFPIYSSAIPSPGSYLLKARVVPYSAVTAGAWTEINLTALCERLPPAAPANVTYTQIQRQEYLVDWDAALDAAIYEIRLARLSGTSWDDAEFVGQSGATDFMFHRPVAMNYALVRARDAAGNWSTAHTQAAFAGAAEHPIITGVTALGNKQYRIDWTAFPGATSYTIESSAKEWESTARPPWVMHGNTTWTTMDITISDLPCYVWVEANTAAGVVFSPSWLIENVPRLISPTDPAVQSASYSQSGSAGSDAISAFEVIDHNGTADQSLLKVRTSGKLEVIGGGSFGANITVNGSQSTINNNLIRGGSIELGYGLTGDRNSYIDFHSDDTNTDLSFRIIRTPGVNGYAQFVNNGTSSIQFYQGDQQVLALGSDKTVYVFGQIVRYWEDWISVTFQNGWTDYGAGYATCAYRKMPDGRIEVKGLAKNGTLNAAIFTLPVGYRPAEHRIFAAVDGTSATRRIQVGSDGTVVSFGAASNAFQSVEFSFYP